MKSNDFIAKAQTTINVPADKVWEALITPAIIKKYMFGTTVTSDFKKRSPITWKGEWQGKFYEDKGIILEIIPKIKLQYTHFSPLSGLADIPENYHSVILELKSNNNQTDVFLSQDNNTTEQEKEHSEKNWAVMLSGLKELLEGKS